MVEIRIAKLPISKTHPSGSIKYGASKLSCPEEKRNLHQSIVIFLTPDEEEAIPKIKFQHWSAKVDTERIMIPRIASIFCKNESLGRI